MALLDTIKTASFVGPTRFALHSVEGFGKTTLAAEFPAPLFICGERGFPRDLRSAPRFVEPKSWEELRALVTELATTKHAFQSVVFDTMDWIEPLIWRYVCTRDTGRKTEMNPHGRELLVIEDYGFGKGYVAAQQEMRSLLMALDELQTRTGMHIVVLMHSHVKTTQNPAGDNYDRWQPKMHDRCARLIVEWCENVFFGFFEVMVAKDDPTNKREKAKGTSSGRRILGTRHNALYDAKNRMNLPDTIELGDPNAIIPYLLGQHIKPPVHAPAAPPVKSETKKSETTKKTETKKSEPASEKSTNVTDAIREQYEANVRDNATIDAAGELAQTEDMLSAVESACGVAKRKQVEKWLAAADSPDKIKWCFAEAQKLVDLANDVPR